jgi:hypothetical protein
MDTITLELSVIEIHKMLERKFGGGSPCVVHLKAPRSVNFRTAQMTPMSSEDGERPVIHLRIVEDGLRIVFDRLLDLLELVKLNDKLAMLLER